MSDEEDIIDGEGEEEEETEPRNPLECPVCEERFDDPRILPCLHSVCQSCLTKKFGVKKGVFNCPECNEKVSTPKTGLDAFPKNVLLAWQLQAEGDAVTKCRNCDDDAEVYSWCGQCLQFLCQTCHEAHLRVPLSREHALVAVGELEKTDSHLLEEYKRMVVCRKHRQKVEKLCRKCNVVICKRCTVTDHDPQRGHDVINLEVAVAHYKELLEYLGKIISKKARILKTKVKHVKEESEHVSEECSWAEHDLIKHFLVLERYVHEHKDRMKKKLDAAYNLMEDEIESKKREAEEALASIKEATEMANEVTKDKYGEDEMIAVTGQVVARLDALSKHRLGEEALGNKRRQQALRFARDQKRMNSFQGILSQLGDIQLSTVIPPTIISPPEDDDDISDPITCGIRSGITVVSFGGSRQIQKLGAYALRADVRDPDDVVLPCAVHCVSGDTYLCQFRPQVPGDHTLNVKLGGQHINLSPLSFRVNGNNPVCNTTKSEDDHDGGGNGNLVNPVGVAVDHRGDIYVTDRDQNNSRVVQYDTNLEYRSEFILPFGDIYDIAADRQGRLIISEHNNNSVHIYTNQGKEEGKIENREMKKPCGVSVNRNDDIVVADSQVKCVFVFSRNKKLLHKFGIAGTEQGQLGDPTFLSVEPGSFSHVYVSDTGNDKIVAYNRKGVFENEIAAGDLRRGKLSNPKGVARDRHGYVLVCDEMNQVMVYTHEGSFVACIDSGGDQLSDPQGIATTNDGYVIVADTGSKCVKKYRYL